MQYIFLKTIVETVLTNFQCPQCQSKTNEQSVQIAGVSSSGMDIMIHCESCNANTQLNAEINTIAAQMLQNEHGRKYFEEFLKQGGALGAQFKEKAATIKNPNALKDEDIQKVRNDLNNIKSIEDLMN